MQKKCKELAITDEHTFYKVMTSNPDLCKQLLECVLQEKVRMVSLSKEQKVVGVRLGSPYVRLYVYPENNKDAVYIVWMQMSDIQDLPQKARFCQEIADLGQIENGVTCSNLRRNIMIFFTVSDPFGESRYIYTFDNACIDMPDIHLGDDTRKIFVNANGPDGNIPDELKEFLSLMKGENPKEGSFAKQIQKEVEKTRIMHAGTVKRND